MKSRTILFCIIGLTLAATGHAQQNSVAGAEVNRAHVERQLQKQLAVVQQRPSALSPFVSDGCSGGLSAGWQLLAQSLPWLGQRFGDTPPWQHCCVAHDRQYWRGPAINGVALRLAADQSLKNCVLATRQLSGLQEVSIATVEDPGITAARINPAQPQTELDQLYAAVAELIYQAVRVGGVPCSGLPWRWGYGWPQCGVASWLEPES